MSELSNYIKIEEFKSLIIAKLRGMGYQKYIDVANDDDLAGIMILCNTLLHYMNAKDDKDEVIELLVTYIVGLWARLLIHHGDDINEL